MRRLLLMLLLMPWTVWGQGHPAFTNAFDTAAANLYVQPLTNYSVYTSGNSVVVSNGTGAALRVFDYYGENVYVGVGGDIGTLSTGWYGVESESNRAAFIVLPTGYAASSYFGTSPANLNATDSRYHRNRVLGTRWARMGTQTRWDVLEPTEGNYQWANLDARVAACAGQSIILMAYGNPSWVPTNTYHHAFSNYVHQLVARYTNNSDVVAIEFFNEPTSAITINFTNEWRVALYEATRLGQLAARAVNPTIIRMGPAWSDYNIVDTTNLVAQGYLDLIDVFTLHNYDLQSAAPDSWTWDDGNVRGYSGAAKYPTLYQGMKNLQTHISNKPISVNEIGLYANSALGYSTGATAHVSLLCHYDYAEGANRAFKAGIMYLSAGVHSIHPHNFTSNNTDTNSFGTMGGWDGVRSGDGPWPHIATWSLAHYWTAGKTFSNAVVSVDSNYFAYVWTTSSNTTTFAWTKSGTTNSNAGATLYDFFGNTVEGGLVSTNPVFFTIAATPAPYLGPVEP